MSKVRKWIMEERLGHQKPDCKTAGSDPRIKLFGQTISCSGTTEMVVSAGEARPRSPIPEVIDESTPRSGEEFGSSSGSNSGSEEDTKGGERGRNDSPDLKSEEKESKKMQQDQNSVQNVHPNQHNQQAKQKLEPGSPEGEGEDTGMGISTDKTPKKPDKPVPCPRCDSLDTKFCYYNNYNVNQPRHFCKNCQRYWTAGGMLRNVPVGAGRRKNKHSNSAQQWHVMQDGLVRSDAPDHGAKSRLDMCAEPSSSGSIITNLSHGTGPGFNLAFSSLMPESSHAVELPAKQVCKRSDSEVSSGSPVGSETPVIASENAAEAWGGSVPVALLDKAWSFGYNLAMKSSAGGGSGNIPSVGNIPSLWPWPGAVWGAGGWGSANWPMAMAMTKLGKHEREKPYPEGSGDGFLWVPKTQRCGEPANPVTRVLSELSQSPPSLHPGSIFKAFQPKPDSSCHRLHAHSDANPAAIARSVSFQESN